jgi:protein-S-isoprenylcysteine O-methyltransferase Ste14
MLQQHLTLALMWIAFCVLHSVLADTQIKKSIALKAPGLFKNYRFFYTLFAFVTLGIVVYYQVVLLSPLFYKANIFTIILGWAFSILGGLIMLICIKKYFLSLSGLKSLVAEQIVANELRIDGIHRYVRHPLYLGTFLFIWGLFLLLPYLSLLIANFVITTYTLYAIRLEERKLVDEFGEAYLIYKEEVPMILPRRIKVQG